MRTYILIVAAFVCGALTALPFTASTFASESDEEETVCCRGFYGENHGFMSRNECVENAGDVAKDSFCSPTDAVAERTDAANVEGARDIGDIPSLSMDNGATTQYSCSGQECYCLPGAGSDSGDTCVGMKEDCYAKGATEIVCTYSSKGGTDLCKCVF